MTERSNGRGLNFIWRGSTKVFEVDKIGNKDIDSYSSLRMPKKSLNLLCTSNL